MMGNMDVMEEDPREAWAPHLSGVKSQEDAAKVRERRVWIRIIRHYEIILSQTPIRGQPT